MATVYISTTVYCSVMGYSFEQRGQTFNGFDTQVETLLPSETKSPKSVVELLFTGSDSLVQLRANHTNFFGKEIA